MFGGFIKGLTLGKLTDCKDVSAFVISPFGTLLILV